LTTAGHDMRM